MKVVISRLVKPEQLSLLNRIVGHELYSLEADRLQVHTEDNLGFEVQGPLILVFPTEVESLPPGRVKLTSVFGETPLVVDSGEVLIESLPASTLPSAQINYPHRAAVKQILFYGRSQEGLLEDVEPDPYSAANRAGAHIFCKVDTIEYIVFEHVDGAKLLIQVIQDGFYLYFDVKGRTDLGPSKFADYHYEDIQIKCQHIVK